MHFGFYMLLFYILRFFFFLIFGFNQLQGITILLQHVFNGLFCFLKITRDWKELEFRIPDFVHSQLFYITETVTF